MTHTTFAERLAFARLVRLWRTGLYAGNAEIARAVGHTGQWMSKWAGSETPPPNYLAHAPLAAYLEVDERWLIRGEGEPPRPDLWAIWIEDQRRRTLPASATPPRVKPAAGKELVKKLAAPKRRPKDA